MIGTPHKYLWKIKHILKKLSNVKLYLLMFGFLSFICLRSPASLLFPEMTCKISNICFSSAYPDNLYKALSSKSLSRVFLFPLADCICFLYLNS